MCGVLYSGQLYFPEGYGWFGNLWVLAHQLDYLTFPTRLVWLLR